MGKLLHWAITEADKTVQANASAAGKCFVGAAFCGKSATGTRLSPMFSGKYVVLP
ncbi:hypothetical protein AAE02nite_21920 [Adhaeribacter aerolatus]|uniref:Uncharacterized protein n=1 Tax=Adhaeribacter aerolatus TaxID=670289 RepID=A0A512AXT8_9BACT|nr:hypothetical protein [Adhaeribacter aerolatus]GEO04528.1 hypothetical protein AAE02nite_21920 [Adhaeribacter aerolatus]